MLAEAARAARSTSVAFPLALGERVARRARWGEVADVTTVSNEKDAKGLGSYVAKYTTKSTHDSGALDHRLTADDLQNLEALSLRPHEATLVRSCWRLGGRKAIAHLNLRRHARAYGYRGNCLTHSRAYSTSFTALRAARHAHHCTSKPSGRTFFSFAFAGRGYATGGDRLIVMAFWSGRESSRLIAWEEASSVINDTG
jgi:hypothetical protein